MLYEVITSSEFTSRTVRGRDLTKQGFFHISNATNIETDESISRRQLFGVFTDLKLRWNNILYLNLSGRNDWSSTLPKENNLLRQRDGNGGQGAFRAFPQMALGHAQIVGLGCRVGVIIGKVSYNFV